MTPVIDRGLVGKEYPPFYVSLSEDLSREVENAVRISPPQSIPSWPPPLIWPALMTLRGTACLIPVWEDLGVDPLEAALVEEEFQFHKDPVMGEQITGVVTVEEIDEFVEAAKGIEDQVDLRVDFRDSNQDPIATYRCAYRVPVAVTYTNGNSRYDSSRK